MLDYSFYGKSTGKGGLALWTHNLNSKEIVPHYTSSYYKGPALKVGSGVMGGDVARFASESGYRVITGGCPTVGMAGGYTQGGGISLLSGLYGLGAANVLEWEVVTTDGQHVIATPTQHTDLFWALSGGGGGTYGVVISMTTRLFPDGLIGRATFTIASAVLGSSDAFWGAVETFHSYLIPLVDNGGITVSYALGSAPSIGEILEIVALSAPNRTATEVAEILTPLTSAFAAQGISLAAIGFATGQANNYQDHYDATVGPTMANASSNSITSGRMILRDNVATAAKVSALVQAFRNITASGSFFVLCDALNPNGLVAPVSTNSLHPTWTKAIESCEISGAWDWSIPYDAMLARQADLTSVATPILEAVTPGSAVYLNEGNYQQPDWQDAFYGSNYAKLRAIKKKYDPADLFYGLTAVGSETWAPDSQGRLCRTGQ